MGWGGAAFTQVPPFLGPALCGHLWRGSSAERAGHTHSAHRCPCPGTHATHGIFLQGMSQCEGSHLPDPICGPQFRCFVLSVTDGPPSGVLGGPSLLLALVSHPHQAALPTQTPPHVPPHHVWLIQVQGGGGWGARRLPVPRSQDQSQQSTKAAGSQKPPNTLILNMDALHLEKGLYTHRTSPERQAVEGVPEGPPRLPNQPAQGLSGGLPLPQLCRAQGVTKPAPLADDISSSHREPQVGSGGAGTSSELGTRKHACE